MGDGVFRAGLHPGRQAKESLGLSTVKGFAVRSKDLCHGHDGTGEGAGLVHDDGVDALGTLQRLGSTDEHPHAGAAPGPGEQRQWGGESQRTRAGDDEHRDGRGEGRRHASGGEHPHHEGEHGDADDRRDEDCRDLVGQVLAGRASGLGLVDETGDVGELGVVAHGGRLYDEPTGAVDRRTDDGVPRTDLHRHGLTGEHRVVDGRASLDDGPVGADAFPGAHDEPFAHPQGCDGSFHLGAVTGEQVDDGRTHVEQGLQCRTGLGPAAMLDVTTRQDEHDDADGCFEVQRPSGMCLGAGQSPGHVVPHADTARITPDECPQGPSQGGQGPHADEGVHGRRAMLEVHPGCAVEAESAPEHHGQGERQADPLPGRELQCRRHGQHDDRQTEHHRPDEAMPQLRLAIDDRFASGRRPGLVSGAGDDVDEVVLAHLGRGQDVCLGRGVVDGGLDPVDLVELLGDPGSAGGATHTGDVQVDGSARPTIVGRVVSRHDVGARATICRVGVAGRRVDVVGRHAGTRGAGSRPSGADRINTGGTGHRDVP